MSAIPPRVGCAWWIAATLCASCWTPQLPDGTWEPHILAASRARDDVGAASRAAAPDSLATSPLGPRGVDPAPGDSVVYSIEITTPKTAYRRYLRLTVLEDPNGELSFGTLRVTQDSSAVGTRHHAYVSRVRPVRVESFDAAGEPLDSSVTPQVLVDLIALGFADACDAYLAYDDDTATTEQALALSLLGAPTILAISGILESDTTLYDLAFDIVDASLAWTTLWNFGIRFSIEANMLLAERVAADPVLSEPGYRFPVQFAVNGHAALRIAATVVTPRTPLGICAGITAIDGHRPSDDRYRVSVRLVPPFAASSDAASPLRNSSDERAPDAPIQR